MPTLPGNITSGSSNVFINGIPVPRLGDGVVVTAPPPPPSDSGSGTPGTPGPPGVQGKKGDKGDKGDAGNGGLQYRTLLIKDTTVNPDIADNIPIQIGGTPTQVVGVLRVAILADLSITINLNGMNLIDCTIPSSAPLATSIIFTSFNITTLNTNDVLTVDITASDGSIDQDGIASFTLKWTPSAS